jgi:PST family polysaccharide transporter
MKYITYINVFFKSTFTICIFIFVGGLTDIWLIPLFTSLGFLLSGISSLFLVRYKFNLHFYWASFSAIKKQLIGSYHFFLSDMYLSLLANTNVIVLEFVAGSTAVGIYSIAEKVIRAAGNLLNPIVNVLYPFVAKKIEENLNEGILLVQKIAKWGTIIISIVSVFIFIYADFLFHIIFEKKEEDSLRQIIIVFRILSVFPVLSFLDQVYGKLILITMGREKLFSRVFFVCSVLNIFFCYVLSYLYQYKGAAIANTIIQLIVAFGMYYYAKQLIKKAV